MKIRFAGKTRPFYRGMNSITNSEIQLAAGQEIELPDEQAERLLKDYPKDFSISLKGKEKAPDPEPKKEPTPEPEIKSEPDSEIPLLEPKAPKAKKKTAPKVAPKKSKNKRVK